MTIVDRYVLRLYFKVFLVCFVSLTGLYVIVEVFNNLEEFLELGREGDGLVSVLTDYFVARAFSFFDKTSFLIALMAAIFTVGWLQKTNEMTSITAAGVPQWRVIKPVIAASILVSLLATVNREFAIPMYRSQLVRNAQSWSGDVPQPMQARVDHESDFFFSGNQVVPTEGRVIQPNIHFDRSYPLWGGRINAEHAEYFPATDTRPAGFLCSGVSKPRSMSETPSLEQRGVQRVMSPADHDWLESDQCFVVSNIEFGQLVSGDQLLQYGNTLEIVKNIRSPSQDYGAGLRVTAHSRLLRPLLDLSLLMLGLPMVIARRDRNIFVAAGLCVGVIAVFSMTLMFFGGLGTYGVIPPYAAAWGPVAVFVPIAAVATGTLRQ